MSKSSVASILPCLHGIMISRSELEVPGDKLRTVPRIGAALTTVKEVCY